MKQRGVWLAAVALALAQSCCVWIWLLVIGTGQGGPLAGVPALLLPLHAVLAAMLPVILLRRGWLPARRASVLYAAAIVAIGVSLAPALVWRLSFAAGEAGNLAFTAVGLGIIWWRGAVLADNDFVYDAVLAEWRWYTVALIVALVIGAGSGMLQGATAVGPALLLFLLGSLVALAASWRLGLTGRLAMNGPWTLTLALAVVVLVVPALLGAVLLGPSFGTALGEALGALYAVVLLVLSPVLWVASWLVGLFIDLGLALEHLFGVKQRVPHVPQAPGRSPLQGIQVGHQASGDPWILIALAVAIALLLAYLLMRRATQSDAVPVQPETPDEERETLLTWREAWSALLSWLAGLRRRKDASVVESLPAWDDTALSPAALTVREIYRRLLALGAARDLPHASTETPHEYLARLRPRFINREKDVSLITAAYVHTRYGPVPATPTQAEQVRVAWDRVVEDAVMSD